MRKPTSTAFLLLSVLALVPSASGLSASDPINAAEIVESAGRSAIEKAKVVGLTIGVARRDEILCIKAFGLANVELNAPTRPETVYRIGSNTKPFTATAILLLIEDGKVKLDDPLSKFLPDYPAHGQKVTVRHLLQHTSGVKDFTRLPAYRKELPNYVKQEEVLARFKDLPLDFQPGDKHQYSNSGYFLLAVVVEKASGKPFEKFVEDRILNVTDLKQTYCDTHLRVIPHRASGYTRWGGSLKNARYINLRQTIGAGNMASTAGDLLRWQQALISGRLLKPETFRSMRTRGRLSSGKALDQGLGLLIRKVNGHEVLRHSGGISGFRSDLVYYPKSGYMIAVMANSENARVRRISDQIAKRLIDGGR